MFIYMVENYLEILKKLKVKWVKSSSVPITRQVDKVPAVIYYKMIDTLGLACNDKEKQ
jgi:hypothetical protein